MGTGLATRFSDCRDLWTKQQPDARTVPSRLEHFCHSHTQRPAEKAGSSASPWPGSLFLSGGQCPLWREEARPEQAPPLLPQKIHSYLSVTFRFT